MTDLPSAHFNMVAFKRHLAADKAPFGGEFNATINEVVEGYREIIADQQQELRIARFDAEVPVRELREENERLLNIINVAAEYLRQPWRTESEGRALAALALDGAGESSDA